MAAKYYWCKGWFHQPSYRKLLNNWKIISKHDIDPARSGYEHPIPRIAFLMAFSNPEWK
jgi:hypothetical protein